MSKPILKFVWKSKETRIVKKSCEKENRESKFNPYQRQCDIGEGIAHESMQQKRKFINISTQMCQFYFWQKY